MKIRYRIIAYNNYSHMAYYGYNSWLSYFVLIFTIFTIKCYITCVRSAQRGALREINVDTLVSTLTRRGRH